MTKPKKKRTWGVDCVARAIASVVGKIEEVPKVRITWGGDIFKKVGIITFIII